MSVAWVGAGISALGVVSGARSASKALNAQQSTANAQLDQANRALDAQISQAREIMEFNRQVYQEGKIRQIDIDALNKRVIDQQMSIAEEQADRSRDSWDFYQSKGRPMVERAFDDANRFDSEENLAQARGRAVAGVQQQFAAAERQQARTLQRLGINPNSGKFMALQNRLAIEKAAASAGAANQVDEGRRAGAVQMRQGAANLAQGFPAQATSAAGTSVAGGNAAVGAGNMSANQNLNLSGQAIDGMARAGSMYGSAAGGYANLFGGASSSMNGIVANNNANMQGWGNLLGFSLNRLNSGGGFSNMQAGFSNTAVGSSGFGTGLAYGNEDMGQYFADGGMVRGPGTGTSDSVPAVNVSNGQPIRLSNGEYVISADVVKAKGVEFFDNLQRKHHQPVNTKGNLR